MKADITIIVPVLAFVVVLGGLVYGATYDAGKKEGYRRGFEAGEASAQNENPYSNQQSSQRMRAYCKARVSLPYDLVSLRSRDAVCDCFIDKLESEMNSAGWTSINDYYGKGMDQEAERTIYADCI